MRVLLHRPNSEGEAGSRLIGRRLVPHPGLVARGEVVLLARFTGGPSPEIEIINEDRMKVSGPERILHPDAVDPVAKGGGLGI